MNLYAIPEYLRVCNQVLSSASQRLCSISESSSCSSIKRLFLFLHLFKDSGSLDFNSADLEASRYPG
jgi:hypothetical protein